MSIIQGDGFNVNIIKSTRRKTMALKVSAKGVFIHIPKTLPLTIAKNFVTKKTAWIQKKLHQQSLRQSTEPKFIDGESLLFLGESYQLRLIQQNTAPTVIKNQHMLELHGRINRLSKTGLRSAIIHWYKKQAQQYLNTRTALLANKTGLSARSITIKTYKARWGSCSIKGDIFYNWQLMQTPADIIDYVIVHELCHLRQHNHSPLFWQLVEQHYPNYKTARTWLKNNGYTLNI